MVQPRPVSLTQVNEGDYEGAYEPEPLLIVGTIPGGGGGGGGSTAWSDITGKPSTFAPSAHTQAISTITGLQSALDLKADDSELATVSGLASEAITLAGEASTDADAALSGLSTKANTADVVPNTRTVAGKPLSSNVTLDKLDVGLSNVDNTSDVNKPVSSAQQTALNLKANTADVVPTTRTVAGKALSANVTLVKGDVGLGNVDNTSDTSKPVSTATQTALDAKVPTSRTVAGRALTSDVPRAALNTLGLGEAIFIPKNGTVPGGTPTYTIVIEAEA